MARARKQQTVSERIRAARVQAGLTQEGLARAADLTVAAVSRIECGAGTRVSTLERLAAALGVPAAELLG